MKSEMAKEWIMNKKPKVLQLIDSLNPGGAEMMAVNIANELSKDGINSYICATRKEGTLKLKIAINIGYLFLNKTKVIDIKSIRKLHRYILKHKIDVIHAHSSSYFMGFLIKMLHPKTQLIWHNHFGNSHNLPKQKKIPLILISNLFDKIISVNKKLNEWAKDELKCENNYELPNFATLNNVEVKVTILKGIDFKRIVCLANLRKEKDHLNLLNAFLLFYEKHTDWTLHFVGMDYLDVYSTEIKNFIKRHKLQNHVFLYGSCTDIKSVLGQASIGVLSSNFEGLPVSLLEYGLAKLPVVVTNVGGCGKVVKDKVNGLVVPKRNKVALSAALLELMENKEMRTFFGIELFKSVEGAYGAKVYIEQLRLIYDH